MQIYPPPRQFYIDGADRKSNMAARAHNVFWLVEILKIFLLDFPVSKYILRIAREENDKMHFIKIHVVSLFYS
jgi:hypothetical protein